MELNGSLLNNISSWLVEGREVKDTAPFPIGNSSSSTDEDFPYYGDKLAEYNAFYANFIHGYFSIIVCSFGVIASIMNIIVFTRRNMISPMNIIFTGLAFADMTVMLTTMPFNSHYYIRFSPADMDRQIYGWAVYEVIYNHCVLVSHTISIWLTVTVAIWRYMTVYFPAQTMRWRSLKRAKIAVALTYITCPIFCIPFYFTYTVENSFDEERGHLLYYVSYSKIILQNNNLLYKINFWIFSVVTKLVPCVVLTILSFLLIKLIYKVNDKHKRSEGRYESSDSSNRITTLLLVVLLLFILAEFPHGMLALLSAVFGEDFLVNVYLNLLETLEDLILINCSVNFVIYCSMSREFRHTFMSLLSCRRSEVNTPRFLPKFLQWSQTRV